MRAKEISNVDDVIDSRDVIARIEELQDETSACSECRLDRADHADTAIDHAFTIDEELEAELKALTSLQAEAEGYFPDSTLIRDSYFKDYAQDLAEDIGAVKRGAEWPNMHIDWDAAADALKEDYTRVEFDGVDYWVR